MMTSIKRTLHKATLAKHKYLQKISATGVTFDEYCHYLYSEKNTGENLTTSTLFGVPVKRNNTFWFVQNVEEVFIDEVYRFNSKIDNPLILDCGSNIGLSLIYFKRLFPKAKIIGFEPDANIYKSCKDNLTAFGYNDVDVINAAVWNKEGTIHFLPDNSLGGKIIDSNIDVSTAKEVKSVRLKSYLDHKVDFLKIDIEGAEYEVLQDCKEELKKVDKLFVEYHSQGNNAQYLQNILQIIADAGFRYYIKEAWNNMSYPFIDSENVKSMFYDMQLNIFAYR